MSMGFTTHKHLDLSADDEDPSQLITRPGWDAPHVRCLPRTFCAWPCLLRQVGTVLGSPCDCIVIGNTYANPGSRHLCLFASGNGTKSIWTSSLAFRKPRKEMMPSSLSSIDSQKLLTSFQFASLLLLVS